MPTEKRTPRWRNFLIWSLAGAALYSAWSAAIIYLLDVTRGFPLVEAGSLGARLQSAIAPEVGLGLLVVAIAWVGFEQRDRRFSLRRFWIFAISRTLAVIVFLLAVWGFGALAGSGAFGTMGISAWVAAGVGMALVIIALVGSAMVAVSHKGALLMDGAVADDLRERRRLIFCSYMAVAASGLALILLSIGGPGGAVPLTPALAGALLLFAVSTAMSIAAWRLFDELDRTLAYEAGNMAFYLIVLLGGGWAMLAHLGLVAAPAPLDWLTMFTALPFVASAVAAGRRGLIKESPAPQ